MRPASRVGSLTSIIFAQVLRIRSIHVSSRTGAAMVVLDWLCRFYSMFSGATLRRLQYRGRQQQTRLCDEGEVSVDTSLTCWSSVWLPAISSIDTAPETTSGGGTADGNEVTNSSSEPSSNSPIILTGDNGTDTSSISTEPETDAASAGGPVASAPTGQETVTTARLLFSQVTALLESSSLDRTGSDGTSAGLSPEFEGSNAFVSGETPGNAGGNIPWDKPSGGTPGNGISQMLPGAESSGSNAGGTSGGDAAPRSPLSGSGKPPRPQILLLLVQLRI